MGSVTNRKRVIIALCIGFLLVLAFADRVFGVVSDLNPHHRLHWMVYGYDQVWYHNRTYLLPIELTSEETEKKYGQGEKFVPTGDKVIGLPVYETSSSLEFQKQRQVVSTLLFLKKPNGNFIVYALSGGP